MRSLRNNGTTVYHVISAKSLNAEKLSNIPISLAYYMHDT